MKANEFIKKHGWNAAKKIVRDAPELAYESAGVGDYADKDWSEKYPMADYVVLSDLKQLIKSHELVESYGGIDAANKTICDAFHGSNYPIPDGHEKLSLAIQDVESCQ